jgi:hypothetical protein
MTEKLTLNKTPAVADTPPADPAPAPAAAKRPGTITVMVSRDLTCTVAKRVYPWEVPIIKAQWGGQADVQGFTPGIKGDFPDAEDEFARLEGVYGVNPDTKRAYVEEVYGTGETGIDRLDEAIAGSWEPPKPRESRKSRIKRDADE